MSGRMLFRREPLADEIRHFGRCGRVEIGEHCDHVFRVREPRRGNGVSGTVIEESNLAGSRGAI